MTKTVTIAGGGLAGLTLGIALRRAGVRVVLHEAGTYPRHRVCGEFLSGVSEKTLDRLGVPHLLNPAEPLQTVAWFGEGRPLLRARLPAPARGISRYRLDAALSEEFTRWGGELVTRSRQRPRPAPGFIWSAGRRPDRGRWIGLKCHVRGMPLENDLEMHLGRGGYVGLARLGDGTTNLCGLFRVRAGLVGKGRDLLGRYLEAGGWGGLSGRLKSAELDPHSIVATAGFRLGWQKVPENLAVIGDACGMIPPFTGNGMSMAFEAAECALDPLLGYAAGRLRWEEVLMTLRDAQRDRFARRLRWAGWMHPFLTTRAGQVFLAAATRTGLVSISQCLQLVR